jgi:ribonuclease R
VPRRGRRDRGDGPRSQTGPAAKAHPGRSPRKKDRKPGKHKAGKGKSGKDKSKQSKSGKGKSGKGKSWTP